MRPATLITIIIAVALIIGLGIFMDRQTDFNLAQRAPATNNKSNLSSTLSPNIVPPPPPETLGWQVYKDEERGFMLRYPVGWSVNRRDGEPTQLEFTPAVRTPFEVERRPRILLDVVPSAEIRGENAALIEEWFLEEIQSHPEKFNAERRTVNDDPLYTWSEGVGEYPHEYFLLERNELVYRFTIEASDEAMHRALPLMVESLRFDARAP